MKITINYYGQAVSVSVEVYEYLTQADHKTESLAHEQQRHWDGHEFDEYIIAAEGHLPYCVTPKDLICQWETLDEILAVLALCTDTQRERFLLYALQGVTNFLSGMALGAAVERSSEGDGVPTVSPSNPKQGDIVTVTPKPDGTYTFRHPSGRMTIEIEYIHIPLTDLPWSNPFTDVSEGDQFYEAVQFVHVRGLMNGYSDGRFEPSDNISHAQLAQILFNKEGRLEVNYLMEFSDGLDEARYAGAIRQATSQGIVNGYGNGTPAQ